MNSTVAVIGGGITGVLTAYKLSRNGCTVRLFDSPHPHAATLNNPGGLNPLHGSLLSEGCHDIYRHAFDMHLKISHELDLVTHCRGDFRRIHRLFLAFTGKDRASLESMLPLYQSMPGFEASLIDSKDIRRLDPRLPSNVAGGLYTYGNSSVMASDYCSSLYAVVREQGTSVCFDAIVSCSQSDGRIHQVKTTEQEFDVDAVVLAAGAWSQTLLDSLDIYPGLLRPVKGEMLLVDLDDSPAIGFDVTHGLRGFYHHAANQYWLGGTRDDPATDPGPTEAGFAQILDGIQTILPGLNLHPERVLRHCAGYRPTTFDDLPVVGPLLPFSNLIIASGGGSKGMLLAPWLAEIAVAFIVGPPPQVPCSLLPRRRRH